MREAARAQPSIYVILQIVDLVIEDGRQRFRRQRLVGDHAIDTVDELRRKTLSHRDQAMSATCWSDPRGPFLVAGG